MRLLTKTTLYFFITMVALLAITGFYLFHQFSEQLNDRSDKELMADEAAWIDYLETGIENGTTFFLRTRELSINPSDAPLNDYPKIEDVTATSPKTNSPISYRQLSQVVAVGGISYQIVIKKSQEQKAALVTGFTRVMLFVLAGLFLATLIFNWLFSRRLWTPFKSALQKIRTAELHRMQAIHFEKTNTTEFTELNTALNYMTDKIYHDFINMKEFTENAAHEMQTPIAVVQSKLELLLQDSNLNELQLQSVAEASDALNRLGKLNQSLLLLARIENNQYETNELISLTDVSKKYLRLFNELINDKQLAIQTDFDTDFKVKLHPLLADSLVSNLLGNAVKYNYKQGNINIKTIKDGYQISNSSVLPGIAGNKLFKRFNVSRENADASNGLGLAIVKKIADTNGLQVVYKIENGQHSFSIGRNKEQN